MLVYNLTTHPIVYRDRTLSPEGSFDFKDMKFIPERDQALVKAGVLSFGSRPKGWKPFKPAPPAAIPVPTAVPVVQKAKAVETLSAEEVAVEEKVDFGVKKKKY